VKFASRGLVARYATDAAPEGTYLDLLNCEEREEGAMSTRYGSRIVTRDADDTPNGVNYFLQDPIHSLTRLKYGYSFWRYAGSGSKLYRRTGGGQGPYSLIYSGLSGSPFGAIDNSTAQSAINYLFIADLAGLIKDNGSGNPTRWGILPPNPTANTTPYAPKVLLVDAFDGTNSYDTSNVAGWSADAIGTVNLGDGVAVNDFFNYPITDGFLYAFPGVLGSSGATTAALFSLVGNPDIEQVAAAGVSGPQLSGAEPSFTLNAYSGSVASDTVGTITRTVNLDLDQSRQVTDDDLIAIAMKLSDPSAVIGIKLKFDVNGSGYTSSYYYKSISPASYQAGIDGTSEATTAAADQLLANTLGLYTGSTADSNSNDVLSQLQSATANTGQDAWSTIYNRRGDFLAVGNAGQPGQDWASITGWQIEITTTSDASVEVSANGIYLQWGAGPSSFGGVGYDYRYTYENSDTGTESNGSPIQSFDVQYGYVASRTPLIVLRQAIGVAGVYSSDSQVKYVNIYRRGGFMNQQWFYVDRIPNIAGGGAFLYKDVISDSAIAGSTGLQLDNDPPITSSLQTPINTTLTAATVSPGDSQYAAFSPQQVTVADATANFVVGQIVDVGTPENLEQVRVTEAGVGKFKAVFRLTHAAGDEVSVYSTPAAPCDLCEFAYNRNWLAGDQNNPNFLYYSKSGMPESFGPQNYIRVGTPNSIITAIINYRGTLYVSTDTSWYQIIDGSPPYAQPTGSAHGNVSKRGWTLSEGSIWYTAIDGIREFRGGDGAYRTLAVEWIFQEPDVTHTTPLVLVDRTQLSQTRMGFKNNQVFFAYMGVDGAVHRISFNLNYNGRIRNDDVPATAMYLEKDTNTLLFARAFNGAYGVVEDRIGSTDDMGWSAAHAPVNNPITMRCQTPFQDDGKPHNPKNWNMLEVDVNTNGQDMNVSLSFQNPDKVLDLGTFNTKSRQKVSIVIEEGQGFEAYRMSAIFSGTFAIPPVLYQANMHMAPLAEFRTSWDTYWIKFNVDDSKLVKQAYFDYTSADAINVYLFADGNDDLPFFSFSLPPLSTRSVVRVRFGMDDPNNSARTLRSFRMVALTSSGKPFQFWVAPKVEYKGVTEGSSYAIGELNT